MSIEKNNKSNIENIQICLTQNGNTLGTTDEIETLEISFEYQLSEENGPFMVFKTEGWSVDNINEFQEEIKNLCKNLYYKAGLKTVFEPTNGHSNNRELKIDLSNYPSLILSETLKRATHFFNNNSLDGVPQDKLISALPSYLYVELEQDEIIFLETELKHSLKHENIFASTEDNGFLQNDHSFDYDENNPPF